jgi:hypothetical protein
VEVDAEISMSAIGISVVVKMARGPARSTGFGRNIGALKLHNKSLMP